eukprot:SAG11_NODE_2485_length_3303_cov_2.098315_1_plen_77_part_10
MIDLILRRHQSLAGCLESTLIVYCPSSDPKIYYFGVEHEATARLLRIQCATCRRLRVVESALEWQTFPLQVQWWLRL